jgi:hypothetical protein
MPRGPRTKQMRAPTAAAGQVATVQSNQQYAPEDPAGSGSALFTAGMVEEIAAVAQATSGTKGTFDTRDHPDAVTTGQRLDFQIPDDYALSTITLRLTHAMSAAESSKAVRVETTVNLIDVSAGTTSELQAATPQTKTTPDTTLIVREDFLTIQPGSLAPGDKLQFYVKRLGADGADTHGGDWQVMSYEVAYTSRIAVRDYLADVQLLDATDETLPGPGTKGTFDTLDYDATADEESKFQMQVPDAWDATSDVQIALILAMSTSFSGNVLLRTEVELADLSAGTLVALGTQDFLLTPPTDDSIVRTVVIRSLAAAGLAPGDSFVCKVKRVASDGSDTHTGEMQLISVPVTLGITPRSGFTAIEVSEVYLEGPNFKPVSPSGVNGDLDGDLLLASDFESYALMNSTVAAGRIDAQYSGRLATNQTSITSLKIPIKGSAGAQYQVKVYVEGQGATPVYDSTLTAAPTSRTLLALTGGNLSNQPSGEKRYHVVVEATLDDTETLSIGRPFAVQE